MQALIDVIIPVFLVIGFGYGAVWLGWFSDTGVDYLMKFTQNFAIPCLLFQAIASLDLAQSFRPALLFSFYVGALSGFFAGLLGARYIFGRPWEHCVVIGFLGLFSNSVLLGLPLSERAFGADALHANYAIIAIHAPFCYCVGITAMEIARSSGASALARVQNTLSAMFRNALIIGLALGFTVNLSGIALPQAVADGVGMIAAAALPAALFGLGGVLVRYNPEGDLRLVMYMCAVALVLHPAITFVLSTAFDLDTSARNSAVLTAAMAPGINGYIFSTLYGQAMRVAATTVLVGTALTVITTWLWLLIMGVT